MPTPGTECARVLVVCTGNICRSPYIQYSLTAALERAGISDVSVSSAGTRAVPASGVAPGMQTLLAEQGIDVSGFSTRQLIRPMLAEADLVLVAERRHRREAVLLEPRALRRTFTLRQFGRLLPATALPPGRHRAEPPAERVRRLIERCSAARGASGPSGDADDVLDPWGLEAAAYVRSAEQMCPAILAIADALVPRTSWSID